MALSSEQVTKIKMVKKALDVCDLWFSFGLLVFNLSAFVSWTQLGTIFVLFPYSQCTLGGGDINCEFLLEPAKALNVFTTKVRTDEHQEYLVLVTDDVQQHFHSTGDEAEMKSISPGDGWYGLDVYSPYKMLGAMGLVVCTSLATSAFVKQLSYKPAAIFKQETFNRIFALMFLVMPTAIAGSLSCVSCEEAAPGVFESPLTITTIWYWYYVGASAVACISAGVLVCIPGCLIVFFVAVILTYLSYGAAYLFSIFIIVTSTELPTTAVKKILVGTGGNCLFNGGAEVPHVVAFVSIAFVCGIFQKVAAFLSFAVSLVLQCKSRRSDKGVEGSGKP